jgi:hypothetical protein
MEQVQIHEINGGTYFDSFGRKLVKIGNINVEAGDVVWTDGRCIYGNIIHGNPAEPPTFIHGGVDGIPFVAPSAFYLVDKKRGIPNKFWKLSGKFQFLGFVNDEKNFYIAISNPSPNDRTGKWYKLTPKGYTEVCDFTNILCSDGQVSKSGDLLILADKGLYINGILNPRISDSTIFNQMANKCVNKAKSLNLSEYHKPKKLGADYRMSINIWSGRIYDDDSYYLLSSSEIEGQSNIGFDYTHTYKYEKQTVSYAIGLNTTGRGLYNKGNFSFIDNCCEAFIGGYNNNGGGVIYSDMLKGVTDEYKPIKVWDNYVYLTHFYDPYINIAEAQIKDYGYIIIPDISGNGGHSTTLMITKSYYNSEDDFDRATEMRDESDREWIRNNVGATTFYSEYENTTEWIYNYPLNGNWKVTSSSTGDTRKYTLSGGGATLWSDAKSIARGTYVYKLDNKQKDIYLFVGQGLMKYENGKTVGVAPTHNTRIAYMPNISSYVYQLQKLVKSLGGSLEG